MTLKALILYSGIGGMHCGLYHARLLRRLRMRGISPFPPLPCGEDGQEAHSEGELPRRTSRQIADAAQPASDGAATTRQEKRGGLESENLRFDFQESACDAGEDRRREAKEISQEEDDDEKLVEALKGISRDGDSVCIHPIVSEFIRLPPSRTEPWPSSSMQPALWSSPERKAFVFLARASVSSFLPPKKRNKGWELHDILPPETLVRFFSPNEMLALHGFPPSFSFPEADEPRAWPAQRRMVGNSLNVHLVGMLIDFLVEDRDWNFCSSHCTSPTTGTERSWGDLCHLELDCLCSLSTTRELSIVF